MTNGKNKIWKCTLKRTFAIMVMAFITSTGIIAINNYKQYYIGLALMILGIGLFIYKANTWKRNLREEINIKLLDMLKRKEVEVIIDGVAYTGNDALEIPYNKLFNKSNNFRKIVDNKQPILNSRDK